MVRGAVPAALVLWSVLNIRDALATFCTVLIVLQAMRLLKEFRPSHFLIFTAAVLGLGLLRVTCPQMWYHFLC